MSLVFPRFAVPGGFPAGAGAAAAAVARVIRR